MEYRIYSLSENVMTIQFDPDVQWELLNYLYNVKDRIKEAAMCGVREIEVSFYEISVFYRPEVLSSKKLKSVLTGILEEENDLLRKERDGTLFILPVSYDPEFSTDRERMEKHTGLSFREIIQRHSAPEYRVFMLGFLPGFLYLGGMDASIICPRLTEPRKRILPGSVGIAGNQTGIYPIESPGGWNIIGRMPLLLFDWEKIGGETEKSQNRPTIQPMDRVRFIPVTKGEFYDWEGKSLHEYQALTEKKG